MSEENGNNGKPTTASETVQTTPAPENNNGERRKVSPVPVEELRSKVPRGKISIELEGSEQTFNTVLGAEIGLGQKDAPGSRAIPDKIDPYQWFERSSLTPPEIMVFVDMKQLAEHGIGGEALDIPIPEIAEQIVDELRARRSRTDGQTGQSSQRFENEMTTWVARLKAEEAEAAKRAASKNVGT